MIAVFGRPTGFHSALNRNLVVALAAAVAACAPSPPHFSGADARSVLERFAAGQAPADVCTPEGRAVLRGAVRSYAAAMESEGQVWPDIPHLGEGDTGGPAGIDVLLLGALAVGFVEPSDLRGPPRMLAGHIARAYRPHLSDLRRARRVACSDVAALQQELARAVVENERFERLAERERDPSSRRAQDRARRHFDRIQSSRDEIERLIAAIEAKVAEDKKR